MAGGNEAGWDCHSVGAGGEGREESHPRGGARPPRTLMEGMGAREASHILLVPVCREWSPPVLPEWPFSPRPAAGTACIPDQGRAAAPACSRRRWAPARRVGAPHRRDKTGGLGPRAPGRGAGPSQKPQRTRRVVTCSRPEDVMCCVQREHRGHRCTPAMVCPGSSDPGSGGNVARTPWWPTDPGAQSRDHGTARGCCRPGWRRVSRRCAAGEGGHTKGGAGDRGQRLRQQGKGRDQN